MFHISCIKASVTLSKIFLGIKKINWEHVVRYFLPLRSKIDQIELELPVVKTVIDIWPYFFLDPFQIKIFLVDIIDSWSKIVVATERQKF